MGEIIPYEQFREHKEKMGKTNIPNYSLEKNELKKKNAKLKEENKGLLNKLNTGITSTVAFMVVIDQTIGELKKEGQFTKKLEIELVTGLRFGDKVLRQFFKLTNENVKEIWDSINKVWVEGKVKEMKKMILKKIITPEESSFQGEFSKMTMDFDSRLKK